MALPIRDEGPAAHVRASTAGSRFRLVELGLAGCGLAAAVLVLLDVGGAPLAGFKLLVCLILPGWAALSRLTTADPAARIVWMLAASTAIHTLVAVVMAWTDFWHPRPAAGLIVAASAAAMVKYPSAMAQGSALRARTRDGGTPPRGLNGLLPWLLLALAVLMWGVGVAITGRGPLDSFGLLTRLPILWYAAVGVVAGLCVWGVAARTMRSALFMSASTAALVVMLYASATLLADAPRYPWTYKHIAVTNFIGATGTVDPSIDIYNRWPGFFSLSAFLGDAMGYRNALDYAAWAETGFALVDAVLVLAIARTISNRARVYWTATLVFTLANWVNQNYYAPQALSYSLYLTMCLIAFTFLRGTPVPWMSRVENWIRDRRSARKLKGRHLTLLAQRWEQPHPVLQLACVVSLLVLQTVIVVSHQLTPYLAFLALGPLFLLGYLRPRWLGLALLAATLAYLIPNVDYVRGKYGLFSGFNLFANTGYKPPETESLAQGAWVFTGQTLANLAVVLTLLTGVLALAGFARRLLTGDVRTTLVVSWLAFAPALGLLAQSYGGEARFRVYLFSLPWLAIGVAWLFWSGPVRSRRAAAGASASILVMALLFTVVNFQPEAQRRVAADDVAASQWLDSHVGSNDLVFTTKSFFPLLIGPNYPYYLKWGSVNSLLGYLESSKGKISVDGLQSYAHHLRGADNNYIIISDSIKRWAIESRLPGARLLPKLEEVIAHGEGVEMVFSNGTVRIYRITAPGTSPASG